MHRKPTPAAMLGRGNGYAAGPFISGKMAAGGHHGVAGRHDENANPNLPSEEEVIVEDAKNNRRYKKGKFLGKVRLVGRQGDAHAHTVPSQAARHRSCATVLPLALPFALVVAAPDRSLLSFSSSRRVASLGATS